MGWYPTAGGCAPEQAFRRRPAVATVDRVSVLAVLFPGQGTPLGEGGAVAREELAALRPDLLEAVTDAVGEDPFPRAAEGTRWAQPAILAAGLGRWSAIRGDLDEAPALALGHSLGELGALVAAGALGEHDALRLVARRAAACQDAADARPGGMLSLLADADVAARLAATHGLAVACDNAPRQQVLAGDHDRIAAAREAAEAEGTTALVLDVAGAFHSPTMAAAEPAFAAALDEVAFAEPALPVVSAATAAPMTDPRADLLAALGSTVRFREAVLAVEAAGATRAVEVGPGRVLCGLVKRTAAVLRATAPSPSVVPSRPTTTASR